MLADSSRLPWGELSTSLRPPQLKRGDFGLQLSICIISVNQILQGKQSPFRILLSNSLAFPDNMLRTQ